MSRPQRTRKPTKRAEAVAETEELISQSCDPKVAKKRKKHTVQLIALKPKAARQLCKNDLPDYHPSLYLRKFPSRPLIHLKTELKAFRLFITHEIVEILI
jgi:hypothetical protein